ncbi:hypothetical protein QQF64_025545 [Cirrhinus molitorella]|uniref:Uncharacterized protein n=1 Tax=Cirrhinus molitorella TaxID=172907 RepID=A0ABR3NPS1_9TELE
MQENNITDISIGINASGTVFYNRNEAKGARLIRADPERFCQHCHETDREDSGRSVLCSGLRVWQRVCPSSLGYYFSFLLSGGPFRYVTAVPTLTVHERVMRDVSLRERMLCKNYLGVISFSGPSGP